MSQNVYAIALSLLFALVMVSLAAKGLNPHWFAYVVAFVVALVIGAPVIFLTVGVRP